MILASHIRPFDAKQVIYILTDNNETEEIQICDLYHFNESILRLANEYNIKNIDLKGPATYCEKLKREILEKEFNKYNNNQLIINITTD